MVSQYFKLSKRSADRILAEAYAAHQSGRHHDAERLYQKVLRSNPRDAEARNLLGLLYLHRQRFDESARQIRRALAVSPGNPQSHYNLGAALMGSGDTQAAIAAFRKACTIDPGNKAARGALSLALNDAGASCADPQDAMDHYREALKVDAGNAHAAINLGNLQEQTADFEAAEVSFRMAIAAQPDFADAHFQLAHLKQHQSDEADIKAMIALFGAAADKDKALLAHGIAKALEKLERYDEEFEWLSKAHAIKQRLEPFDEQRSRRQFAALRSIAASDLPAGSRGEDLVFVVGMPRSGTTLAEQILASHPAIHGAGEVMSVADLAVSPALATEELENMAQTAAKRIRSNSPCATLAVETTPENFLHLGKIALLFPRAKIVHCIRDPLDTCLSIYQHPLTSSHAYAHDLATLGRYYLEYRQLMSHWQAVIPNPVFDLHYESVVRDLEATVRELLEFCDVAFDPACLEFHQTHRQVKTPSAGQVRQPIYSSSIGRWRRYARELQPLRDVISGD